MSLCKAVIRPNFGSGERSFCPNPVFAANSEFCAEHAALCEMCSKPVREGLRVCAGLSPCWDALQKLRLAAPIHVPAPKTITQLEAEERAAWTAWQEAQERLRKAHERRLKEAGTPPLEVAFAPAVVVEPKK